MYICRKIFSPFLLPENPLDGKREIDRKAVCIGIGITLFAVSIITAFIAMWIGIVGVTALGEGTFFEILILPMKGAIGLTIAGGGWLFLSLLTVGGLLIRYCTPKSKPSTLPRSIPSTSPQDSEIQRIINSMNQQCQTDNTHLFTVFHIQQENGWKTHSINGAPFTVTKNRYCIHVSEIDPICVDYTLFPDHQSSQEVDQFINDRLKGFTRFEN